MKGRQYSTGWALAEALKAEGFPLPEDCISAQVVAEVDAILTIRYDVALSGENLGKLGRALQRLAEAESAHDG